MPAITITRTASKPTSEVSSFAPIIDKLTGRIKDKFVGKAKAVISDDEGRDDSSEREEKEMKKQ